MSRTKRYPKNRPESKTLTLCVAFYYDPAKHVCGKEEKIVRVTAVVYDTITNKQVERLEFSGKRDLDEISDAVVALAVKYDVTLHQIAEPVPLEKCPCGCASYMDRIITAQDLAASPN
jgi:hypothetical protein